MKIVGDKAQRDDAEIQGGQRQGLFIGAGQPHEGLRQGEAQQRGHDTDPKVDPYGLLQTGPDALLVARAVAAGHQGSGADIDRLRKDQHDHARLRGQSDRGNGLRAKAAHHYGIG